MSVTLSAAVYRHQFTRPQLVVLLAMCDEVRRDRVDRCWMSATTIGWKTGYSERQVRRLWGQLEQLGVLTRAGISRYGTIIWRIDPTQAPAKAPRPSRQTPDTIMSDPAPAEDRTSAPTSPDIPTDGPDIVVSAEPRTQPRREPEMTHHAAELTLDELRRMEQTAAAALWAAEDALQRAKRLGGGREVRSRQREYETAQRGFLLAQREREQRERGLPAGVLSRRLPVGRVALQYASGA